MVGTSPFLDAAKNSWFEATMYLRLIRPPSRDKLEMPLNLVVRIKKSILKLRYANNWS
jgi:hypothetical protein